MNGHLPRGLPPIPGHVIQFDPSRPPPSPKELYAQEQYQADQKKQAPPPPRRNPDTRLSSQTSLEESHDRQFTQYGQSPQHGNQFPQQYGQSPQQGNQFPQQYDQSPQHGNQYPQQWNQSPQHGNQYPPGSQMPRRPSHGSPVSRSKMDHSHHQTARSQSPRRHTAGSPVLKSKMDHTPASPGGVGNQPFSYGAMLPSRLHHVDNVSTSQPVPNYTQNKQSEHIMPNSNYPYGDQNGGNSALSYGHHESGMYPQSGGSAPQRPPPPIPNDIVQQSKGMQGQGHNIDFSQSYYPQSSDMQRHSALQGGARQGEHFMSPELTKKLSQRSKSVPCSTGDESLLPPPLFDRDGSFMAGFNNRAPTPPLPPPPPELLEDLPPPPPPPSMVSQLQQNQMLTNSPCVPVPNQSLPHVQGNTQSRSGIAPPPPPPLSSIPKKKVVQSPVRDPNATAQPRQPYSVPPPNVVGTRQPCPVPSLTVPGTRQPCPVPSPTVPGTRQPCPVPPPTVQGTRQPCPVPPPAVLGTRLDTNNFNHNGNQPSPAQPPRVPSDPTIGQQPQLIHQISNVQLRKTEGEATAREERKGMIELSAVKLKPTSARMRLLERDGIKLAQEEEESQVAEAVPEPPPPPEDLPPVEMESSEPIPQVSQAAVMFEKKAEEVAKSDVQVGKKAPRSNMDINIDDIDLNDVPGYTPITKSTPVWKRDMIEKKNQEKIEEYIKMKQKEKEEAEKWKNVPEWKRKLMMEKEKEKAKKSEEELKRAAEEEMNRKKRDKEAEEARKAKIREQQEMERKMQEELQDVPEWKREIMMKRGGAIRNWADEREEENDQVDK